MYHYFVCVRKVTGYARLFFYVLRVFATIHKMESVRSVVFARDSWCEPLAREWLVSNGYSSAPLRKARAYYCYTQRSGANGGLMRHTSTPGVYLIY